MFQNKPDILLFLLYIGTLIFAEKIVIAGTCQISAVKIVVASLIICPIQISGAVNQINFLAVQKRNFFEYLAEWNATKIKYNGKVVLIIFYRKL